MRIRNLYLSIYLTVVAVLLVFALVAGVLFSRHAEGERLRMERVVSDRAVAWAELIERALPGPDAAAAAQAEALLGWARRLRLAIALESASGQRIATSDLFAEIEDRGIGLRMIRIPMSDGRVLLMAPPRRLLRALAANDGPAAARLLNESAAASSPPRPPRTIELVPPPPPSGWLENLQRWSSRWFDEGTLLIGLLGVLFLAIAAGSYPVVRRLTRRLEALQRGVETFGSGQLSHRVAEDGGDEVAGLAASFNRAAQQVEDLVRANRSLLANASHELRSPLARLKMALEMMEIAGPERRAGLRAEIAADIRELDTLVEEVLLASRLDAHVALAHDPVDLAAVAAEEAARVQAQVSMDPAVVQARPRGDERLLRRALRNLLENARRYGGDDVMVELGPGAASGMLDVAVLDRGPGVPEPERERIFEPFYRLPGHAEREGGVGLGLSLVRQIAQRHAGAVRCEARVGGGSRFVLALPL